MKKLLTLLLIVLSVNTFGQLRDSVLVNSNIFTILYSEKLEQPLWIKYEVKCTNGTVSRVGMDFYTNDSIHTSDMADYAGNVYDKGHLAPAADFNCDKATLHKTFTYLNCALQNQYLNRGVWRLLEVRERELAKYGKVQVYIKLYFSKTKLETGATIPSEFYKEISHNGIRECYLFKNEKPETNDYKQYKCNCK